MPTVTLKNTNPLGYVDVPLLGRQGPAFDANGDPTPAGSGCLVPGEEFEVDAEVAGRAPSMGCDNCGKTHDSCIDHGEGLLAQVGNYELVESPATPTVTKKKG